MRIYIYIGSPRGHITAGYASVSTVISPGPELIYIYLCVSLGISGLYSHFSLGYELVSVPLMIGFYASLLDIVLLLLMYPLKLAMLGIVNQYGAAKNVLSIMLPLFPCAVCICSLLIAQRDYCGRITSLRLKLLVSS